MFLYFLPPHASTLLLKVTLFHHGYNQVAIMQVVRPKHVVVSVVMVIVMVEEKVMIMV